MKSHVLNILAVILFFSTIAFGANSEDTEKGKKALQLINHFSTVLYRVTESKDLGLLELEYDRISQENIFLDVIEDEETISIIQQIMTYITKQRLNSKERELLQKWLKEDLNYAIFSTCPNPTGLISANPKAIAITLGQFAFSWFFHYVAERRRLEREYEKQTWELDKDAAMFLNERNTKLLEMYWRLVKRYDIRDAYRITIPEIKEFVKYADNEGNENRVFEMLCLEEEKYRKFPEYWYRRGRAAEAIGKKDEAIDAYRQYQSIYLQFLRKDHMAAEVALNLARLLLDNGNFKKADMMRQLQIIKSNVNADDWGYLYFCGTVYMSLSENQLAYEVLGLTVRELEHLLEPQYNAFIAELKDEDDIEFLDLKQAGSYNLMMCRSAYFHACSLVFKSGDLGKRFSELCAEEMTPGFEMITYCNDESQMCRNLPEEIWENMYDIVAYPDGDIYFRLPMKWFYLGNEMMTINTKMKYKERLKKSLPAILNVYYADGKSKSYPEELDEREFRYKRNKKTGEERFWVNIEIDKFDYDDIEDDKVVRLELVLPLRDLDVKLVYLPRENDLQLFPKEEITYRPTKAIIKGVEFTLGDKDTHRIGSFEEIGNSIKTFYKKR